MKIRGNINRYEVFCRIAGLWCAVLLLFSGCAGSGSAVVIRASDGAETAVGNPDSGMAEDTAENPEMDGQAAHAAGSPEADGQAAHAAGSPETETVAIPGIVVHICGQVANPGVYELAEGSRVWDAVQAAGGFSGDAEPDAVNLAAPLADGCKITIPSQEDTAAEAGDWYEEQAAGQPTGRSGSANVGAAGSLIDINEASAAELTAIPGIGEVRAAAIVAYREASGPFHTVEEIMNVTGIKEGLFEQIKGYITAGG